MKRQILAQFKTILNFYKRNKFIQLIAYLLAATSGTLLIRTITSRSTDKLALIKDFNLHTRIVISMVIFLLGLITISYHTHHKCLSSLITKPNAIKTWLLTVLISGISIAFLLQLILIVITIILSRSLQVPVQTGLVYIGFDNFLVNTIIYSYTIFLSLFLHPALTLIIICFFQNETLYYFLNWARSLTENITVSSWKIYAIITEKIFHMLYFFAPIIHPFSNDKTSIYASLHVTMSDVNYLLLSLLYTIGISGCMYFGSNILIKRRWFC